MFKKILMLSTCLITLLGTYNVNAENVSSDYSVKISQTVKNNEKEYEGTSLYKITKIYNIKEDGEEEKIENPIVVLPNENEYVKIIDKNTGVFSVNNKNIDLTFSSEHGQGIYKLEEAARQFGYWKYDKSIELEFPKIQNGEFAPEQVYELNIEKELYTGGFILELYEENQDKKMSLSKDDISLEITNVDTNEVIKITYSSKDKYFIKDLPEGRYKLKVNSLSDEKLHTPNDVITFSIEYKTENKESILTNVSTEGKDLSFINEVIKVDDKSGDILKLFFYRKTSIHDGVAEKLTVHKDDKGNETFYIEKGDLQIKSPMQTVPLLYFMIIIFSCIVVSVYGYENIKGGSKDEENSSINS